MQRQSYGKLSVEQIIQQIMWGITHRDLCAVIFEKKIMLTFQKNITYSCGLVVI